jgi:hypothetical protein
MATDRANFFDQQSANAELHQQEAQALRDKQAHSKAWWKRGIGQGILGALPGIVTLNPIAAAAGAAGGFGGEATNHFAFKDQHPEIAGNAAALASLGSGAATKGLFSAAGEKAGLGGLEHAGGALGNSDAYTKELSAAKLGFAPGDAPAMPGTAGADMGRPQGVPAPGLQGPSKDLAPSPLAGDANQGFGSQGINWAGMDPEERARMMQRYGFTAA